MNNFKICLFLFVFILFANAYEKRYDGHLVQSCKCNEMRTFEEVIKYSEENLIDVWVQKNFKKKDYKINQHSI